jgi:2-octaprenyl-6-methoxyphenol hydroxylase
VAALADCVADTVRERGDMGSAQTLQAYSGSRRLDVASRVWGVDLLNRSLISDLLPVHLARGLGLYALKTFGPLRRFAVNEGLGRRPDAPALMQPDGAALLARRCGRLGPAAA